MQIPTEGNTRRVPGLAQLIKSHLVTPASFVHILLQGRRDSQQQLCPLLLEAQACSCSRVFMLLQTQDQFQEGWAESTNLISREWLITLDSSHCILNMSYSSSGRHQDLMLHRNYFSWTTQVLRSGSTYVFTEVMAGSGINLARNHQYIYMLTWVEAGLNIAEKSQPVNDFHFWISALQFMERQRSAVMR